MPSEDNKTYFDEGEYFVGGKSNYDKLPGGYNFLRRSLFWMGKIKRILKYKKSGKVLDIGCAYGFLLYFMKNQFEVHGCDISPHAISQCKKLYKDAREKCFFVHDITKPLPYPENYFDVVICQDVLEHIPNLKQSLDYIHTILKNGGILFFRVPIKTKYKATEFLRFENDPSHISVLYEKELVNIIRELGFKILEKRYIWMGAFPLPKFLKFGSDVNMILEKSSKQI